MQRTRFTKVFRTSSDPARSGQPRRYPYRVDEYARERDIRILLLEIGTRQPTAIALYESAGFRTIANFGQYIGDEFSVSMEKFLR